MPSSSLRLSMSHEKPAFDQNRSAALYRVLLIGGYGFFGKKLAERLALDPLLQVSIAGRNSTAARALADELNRRTSSGRFSALGIDVFSPQLPDLLRDHRPDLVIHASGPFQGQAYDVARACIAAGVHYIDLADARDFVAGIAALDAQAKEAGVLVTSGASSVPALSGAAVDALSRGFHAIHEIDIGISPGNRTQRGLATVHAILSYCGAAFPQWRDGRWQPAFGWQEMRRQRYPAPVGSRWLANCDVPDLQLFPARYAGVRAVRFGAGLQLPFLHFGVGLMAGLRRMGLVHDWSRHAALLKKLSDRFIRFGSDAGAMHVKLAGIGMDGRSRQAQWTLVAAHGDGPFVPVLASVILAGKLARGRLPQRGACPCVGMIALDEFKAAMPGLAITMEITQ